MKELWEKIKGILGGIIGAVLVIVFASGWILDAYTYFMTRTFRFCQFDGAYRYEEDGYTIVCLFEDDQMIWYLTDGETYTRVDFEYGGTYYNKGLFDRFVTQDEKWIKIEDADKAGKIHCTCKSFVVMTSPDEYKYLDEDDIEEIEEDEDISYSGNYYFKISDDTLTLVTNFEGESFDMEFERVTVITGDMGEQIETLDSLWEEEFD